MMNIKKIFLIATIMVIISLSAVSAADDSADNAVLEDNSVEIEQNYQAVEDNVILNEKTVTKSTNDFVKEDSGSIDYYVSDTDGSDENDGSQTSPFKTVQTAIDKTDSENQYNIYIAEGVYKGVGNTNLTVPGSNSINFIGSGINKTVFDGEAQFTIPGTGSVWGGSGMWNSWSNTSGNWMMNISAGEGTINIKDITYQNSWAASGSSIVATIPTIDNRATLNVSNVYFFSNHAGNGAGIRNNFGGTLYVDNCIFENNTKSSTTGNYGAAVYNNGTAVITNSQILRNWARWGSVTNDKNITLINCTFEGNIAYDAASGYKNGPSFAADTGITNFFMMYAVYNATSTLINCTFNDNQQCDISNGKGDLYVEGCVFNHSTGVYLFPNNNRQNTYVPTEIITGNTFVDMQPSTVFATTISSTTPSVGVRALSSYNLTIENNNIDVELTDYSYGLYLTANATVINNTLNDYIYLSGANDIVVNNTVNTSKEYTITLTNSAVNATIANNTLYGGFAAGDLSIGNVLPTTTVESNLPITDTFIINNDNYATYFDKDGVLRNNIVSNGSKIVFVNDLTNKNFIFDNVKVSVDVNTTLYNTTIVTENNANVLFKNLKIDNAKTDEDYVILFESEGNTIKNGNIKVVTDKPVQVIKIDEDSNTVTGTTINATIPAADVKYNSDYSIGNVPSAGIFIRSSNNKINNTRLYVYATTADPQSYYPTVDGVDIQSKAVGEYVTGNEIRNSRINVTGGSYVYGLNIARAENTITPLSYFDVTSTYYASAIQIGDAKNNNISGYIYAEADNTAYGYYSTAMATGITNNTNVSKLYIQNMNAPNAVGVRLEGASNTELSSATYNINGENVKAVEVVKDWMENVPENLVIYALTVNLNGANDTSAIATIDDSSNVFINNTRINAANGQGILLTNSTDSTVTNNYLNIGNLTGGDAAVTSNTEATIFNNTPTIAVLTDETYSNFFDENNTLYVDVGILTLGGDLHDKVLIINNHTKIINITNAADYTMYDTTIIIEGNGTYGDRFGFNVENINFNNTNKPVFIDRFNGTGQKNVAFRNNSIYVTGDDIVAFDAFNNESYIYLDISYCDIIMEGQNVVAIDYAGYNRGQPGYVSYNKIYLTATEKAVAYNAKDAAIQFNSNDVEINAPDVVVANLINSTISYYNFRYNDINVNATDAVVLNFSKGDTYTAYISDNEIYVIAENPSTLVNITGSRSVYFQNNEIVLDTTNGEVPVVSVSTPSSYVRNNYILAHDIGGNSAVENTGITISGNTPEYGSFPVTITSEDTVWAINEEGTLSFNFTNDFGEEVTGTAVVTVNDEEVSLVDNTITYTPTKGGEATVKITFTADEDKYAAATETIKVPVTKLPSVIEATVPSENTVNKSVSIILMLEDEEGTFITGETVTITAGENTEKVNIKNGFTVYQYTPTTVGEETITVTFAGNDIYDETTSTITLIVSEDKDKIIEDLLEQIEELNAPKETTITLDEVTDAKYNANVTITGMLVNEDSISLSNQVVTLTIGDKTVELTTKNGEFSYTTAFKTMEDQTVVASYAGNDKYKESEATMTFSINKQDVIVTFDPINDVKYGENVTITGKFTDSEGKAISNSNVKVTIDGKKYYAKTDKTGAFTLSAKVTDMGENTVTVGYSGNDKYNAYEETTTFNVEKQDVIVTYETIVDTAKGDNVTITGTFTDANGNAIKNSNVKITINGKKYYAKTDANGVYTLSVQVTQAGENTVTVGYSGNDKYNAYEETTTFNADKQNVVVTYDAISDVSVGDNVTITGTFTDSNGKAVINSNVKITIDGKKYYAKTDSTGAYVLSVEMTKAGEKAVTIGYSGNANYNEYSTETTFTVLEKA